MARRSEKRRRRAEKAELYSTKMHAALWVIGALVTTYVHSLTFFQPSELKVCLLLKIFRVEIRVIDVAALIGEIIPVASNIL